MAIQIADIKPIDLTGRTDLMQSIPKPTPFAQPQSGDFIGYIGHEWLGGKHQQRADEYWRQLEDQINNPPPNPYDDLINPYDDLQNPYGWGNPGLAALLSRNQSQVRQNFASAKKDVIRSLAMRGQLGQSMEVASMRKVALDEARALSGSESQLRANAYDKAALWDGNNRDKQSAWGMNVLGKRTDYNMDRRSEQMGFKGAATAREQGLADAPKQALVDVIKFGATAALLGKTGGAPLPSSPHQFDFPPPTTPSTTPPASYSGGTKAPSYSVASLRPRSSSGSRGFGGLT